MALAGSYPANRHSAMARVSGRFFHSTAYAGLQRFAEVVSVSLLWAVASMPVITLFPATAAMFLVARRWATGDEPALLPTFLQGFRDNFRQALGIQLIATVVAAGLMMSIRLAAGLPTAAAAATYIAVAVAGVSSAMAMVWVFPLLVTYRTKVVTLLRAALLLGIGRPATTLRCVGVLAPFALLAVYFPPLLVLSSGLVALSVQRWCAAAAATVLVIDDTAANEPIGDRPERVVPR